MMASGTTFGPLASRSLSRTVTPSRVITAPEATVITTGGKPPRPNVILPACASNPVSSPRTVPDAVMVAVPPEDGFVLLAGGVALFAGGVALFAGGAGLF